MTDTDLLSSEFPLWDDINNIQYENGLTLDLDDLNTKDSESPPACINSIPSPLEECGRFLSEAPDPSLSLSQIYLEHALNHHHQLISLESPNISLYPHPLPSPEVTQPPAPSPSLTLPVVYIQPAGTPPHLILTSPTEVYVPPSTCTETIYGTPKYSDRSEANYSSATTPKQSVPIMTLNTNNFSGNLSQIRYLPETSSRKRPNNPLPETEGDSLNAKRIKNREAARRWRQGKKDQISDLQGEVYTLKNKLDAMQTEMETLRIENQYLKQELNKTRQTSKISPPSISLSSPHWSPLSSYPFRLASNPPPANDINFLPTPSLFLLCLFIFSLCISIPPGSSNGAFPGMDPSQGSWSTPLRQPRLFHKPEPNVVGSKLLLEDHNQDLQRYWIFSMFNQVYQRLLPVGRGARNLDDGSVGLLKVPLGEMNKHISSSLRLDKFL